MSDVPTEVEVSSEETDGDVLADREPVTGTGPDVEEITFTGPVERVSSAIRRPVPRLPIVCICGRPNVGKSTLLNRIVGSRRAIVEEHPGVTRDRFEREADWRGRRFTLVDTGGMIERGGDLEQKVTDQALRAVTEADLVLLVLDSVTGLTGEDDAVASLLRRHSEKVIVVANKVDSQNQEADAWALARFGFSTPHLVSALHGRGVGDLLDVIVSRLPEVAPEDEADAMVGEDPPESEADLVASIALVGRPNVGKSTLFNRLVGDERSVVHDVPGTTRDAIDTIVETEEGRLRFIDTAGLRRKARIIEGTEYYSLVRSLKAIDQSNVALLILDASLGVTHQEQRLAERVDAAGSPIVICLNKWDLCDTEQRLRVAEDVADRLGFLDYAPVLRISAMSGLGVQRILPALRAAIDAYHRRIPTGRLNETMREIQSAQPAAGARVLYAVQGAVDPPTITLFTTGKMQPTYLRFIERSLRERYSLGPTALKLRVRPRGGR